jgi:hypothetical protein
VCGPARQSQKTSIVQGRSCGADGWAVWVSMGSLEAVGAAVAAATEDSSGNRVGDGEAAKKAGAARAGAGAWWGQDG